MKRLKLWFAAALLSAAPLAFADPPAQVGRLNFLQGTVSFAPAEANTDWAVAPLNRPITTGDRLWADRDGRAEFRVGPNAMRIAAMTSLDVLRLDDEVTHLRLAQGTLLVRLRRLDVGDSFEISTPSGAVLLTRPGLYRVAVDGSGMPTTVLVREGQADVLTGNAPLSVNASQSVTLSTTEPAFGTAPVADEFERWAYARDNPSQPVVATRYVHPDMTGHEDLDNHGTWQSEPQYGNVWIPTAAALPVGWAPYRYGRWVWVSPWGWTWVDNAPWGFAPYHYGRWVWLGHRWAWAPGPRAARPVYAPALVAFVGGHNWSVSVASGPSVAWVPLGWREPYIPWYRHSPRYVRNVNVTHVTNVTVINQYTNVNNVTRVRYVNRDVPSATTVVTRDTFVRARHVHEARLDVPVRTLAAAQVTHAAPVTRPERQSLVATQPGARLPAAVAAREVIAAREPAPPARLAAKGAAPNERRAAGAEERPRVRVLQAQQGATQRTESASGEKRQDSAPPLAAMPATPGTPAAERGAEPRAAEKAPLRADTKGAATERAQTTLDAKGAADHKAAGEAQRKPAVAMPPGDRERAAAETKTAGDAQKKPAMTTPPGERERMAERLTEKTPLRADAKSASDAQKQPAGALPPVERGERGERVERAERVERTKAAAETKTTGDAQQKPAVAMPPGDRERAAERAAERLRAVPDTKTTGEAPRPPVTTLAPADTQQRLQQQQAEHQARAQQEKQAQDQKQQQERAVAAQQQQERQAREARVAQQKQLQEQQEQQRALAGQQQQERAAQQAREEQQRQARAQQEKQAQDQKQQQERVAAAQQQQERQAREAREREAQQQQRALQQQAAQQQQQERQAREAREEQQRQLQQQRLVQQQQAAQQQQERQAREAREEQQRQARAQQQAVQQQREQQAQLAHQQAEQQRRAAERQQRRAPDNPEQAQARKPKPQPEQAPPPGR